MVVAGLGRLGGLSQGLFCEISFPEYLPSPLNPPLLNKDSFIQKIWRSKMLYIGSPNNTELQAELEMTPRPDP